MAECPKLMERAEKCNERERECVKHLPNPLKSYEHIVGYLKKLYGAAR